MANDVDDDPVFGQLSLEQMKEAMVDKSVPTVSESDFFRVWLPLFAGVFENANMMEWTKVAGSVSQAVNVVDDRTGKVLYTVPPLVRPVTVENENAKLSIAIMVRHASQLRDAGRGKQADAIIINYFAEHSVFEGDVVDELKTWNGIFGRYKETNHLVVDLESLLDKDKAEATVKDASSAEDVPDSDLNGSDEMEF